MSTIRKRAGWVFSLALLVSAFAWPMPRRTPQCEWQSQGCSPGYVFSVLSFSDTCRSEGANGEDCCPAVFQVGRCVGPVNAYSWSICKEKTQHAWDPTTHCSDDCQAGAACIED